MGSLDERLAVADSVRIVLSEVLDLPLDTVTADLPLMDTPYWDSLRAISLVVALEEQFGTRLSTPEMLTIRTVGTVLDLLRAKGVAGV